jgi:hypothetical protein
MAEDVLATFTERRTAAVHDSPPDVWTPPGTGRV